MKFCNQAERIYGGFDLDLLRHLASEEYGEDFIEKIDPNGIGSHERSIFACFQIDLDNYDDVESLLFKEYHQSRNDILDMEYWAFEMKVTKLIERLKKENDKNKSEQDKYSIAQGDPSKMMKQAQSQMPKAPQMPKIQMPNIKFPR